jgi:hypothetical protein
MANCGGYTTTLTAAQLQIVPVIWLPLLRDAGLVTDANYQAELKRRGKSAHYR